MNQVTWCSPGIIGYAAEEKGVIVALRNNGDECLFLSGEKKPTRWIPITEFYPDSRVILTAEDLPEP